MSKQAAQATDYFLDLVADAIEAGLLLPKIGLITALAVSSNKTVLADITQPTFAGYALIPAVPGPRRVDAPGNQIIPIDAVTFQPSGAVSPAQTAIGIFLQDTVTAVDHLVYFELFDTPIVFASAVNARSIIMDIYVRNLPQWGGICAEC